MSNGIPNTAPFTRLRDLIRAEEERTSQFANRVRISHGVANDLLRMSASDWYAASKGFTDLTACERLAGDFALAGVVAANGLSLSVVGPIIEVAEDLRAPEVEIIQGIPRPTSS